MAIGARAFRATPSFITIYTDRRRPVFQVSQDAELFVDTLRRLRMRGAYKLHAYLVLPDRVHLLLTPQVDVLEQTILLIQTEFERRLASPTPVWAPGLVHHSVRCLRDLEAVRAYLHQLPVRAHLTPTPELYPYSSAHRSA